VNPPGIDAVDDCRTHKAARPFVATTVRRRAFSLIEMLVVAAVVALLAAALAPALAAAREAGRAAGCLSNLRQMHLVCRQYADDHRGVGPAIGQPYLEPPNWALVVQAATGLGGSTATELYSTRSVLVCPTIRASYAEAMVRTYAMNATGHAGLPASGSAKADPDDYDDPDRPAHLRLDLVPAPDRALLLVDSRRAEIPPPAPPPTRTLNPIDFRQTAHVTERLGRFHASASFQAVMCDGSARPWTRVEPWWLEPLP
jgi:prepilin-type N-terminal cleavage/methylation domain-containing protein